MANPPRLPLTVGTHDDYHWLATEQFLDDLLKLCPEIVIGKYVAVTSIDSSPFHSSEQERAAGWEHRNGIGYSPVILDPSAIPREGWDEWYIFDFPTDLGDMAARDASVFQTDLIHGQLHSFVNFNFRPTDTDGLAPFFWKQFERIRPLTYVAESDYNLVLITCDSHLFEAAHKAIKSLESPASSSH